MTLRLYTLFYCLFLLLVPVQPKAEPGTAASDNKLRIGYLPVLSNLPIVLAYERDQYNLQGISLRLYRYQSPTGLEAAMRVGAVDLAILPAYSALTLVMDKVPVKILATVSEGGARLYRRIRSNDNESFVDLTIGIQDYGSAEHLTLAAYLDEQQLAEGFHYHTMRVNFESVLADVQKGTIDAFLLPEPFPTRAAANLPGVWGRVSTIPQQPAVNTSVLVCRTQLLADEYFSGLSQLVTILARSTHHLNQALSAGDLEQLAISPAAQFLLGPKEIRELLASAQSFTNFTFAKANLSDLLQLRDQLWTIGVIGGHKEMLTVNLDLPEELERLLSTQAAQ